LANEANLYGILAEFDTPEALRDGAERAYAHGYRRMDAYSPFPVDGLAEAMGFRRTRLPLMVLIGGILGGAGGFYLQYWISVIDYPLVVGGKAFNSWPAFIPVTFELAILSASLTAVLGMLALNGLPKPYHPVFNVERFALASRDRFFLCLEAADPKFDLPSAKEFLQTLKPRAVYEVEP
jgi:hypothetical protein